MISIDFNRTKLVTTVPVTSSLEIKPAVESGNNIRVPVVINDFEQDPIALTGLSWTTGDPTVTGTTGSFANVRVGDTFVGSGGAGVDFADPAIVTAKTGTTLTLDSNALTTETATTGTITSNTMDATVYILELTNTVSGAVLSVQAKLYTMDGTKVADIDNDGYDELTITDGSQVALGGASINLDQFYTNARKARTNS
jgi:hypothetical protein